MKKMLPMMALAGVLAGCCCCECQTCVKSPNVSVFASSIGKVARERKISLAEAADLLIAEGVTGFDCAYNDGKLPEYAATAMKPVNLFGFIKFFDADNGWAQCDDYVATAKKYGVTRIMCVPQNFTDGKENEAEFQKNLSGLKYLVSIAKPAGITVMIEDFGGTANPCSYAKNLKRFLTEIPDLQFALDSGNLYYASRGESILDMLSFAEGRIAHVHLKDQTPADHHVYETLGRGGVENAQVVRTMQSRGYDGWYTLENMVGGDQLEDIARQVGVLRYWCRR